MNYSAGEVAKKLELTKDSLRYYEKEGLLPPIKRNQSGHRTYTESDVEWIFLIRCLRDTDMPIHKIKQYVSMLMKGGNESIPRRRDILMEHKVFLKEKITTYQRLSQLIEKKLNFYDEALNSDNPETAHCMDYATEWEHFRGILRGVKHD
ncbi:MerR family transcriptional regulator [Listeria ilorinensis]|uniref:MerR family transcriptional regulator n=1 Tax=Listeria ilorinensis TaxID=2867439 RepID=UPI001EF3E859|nr:MerR family transcriptional regulator [Listeria ilorinensis]